MENQPLPPSVANAPSGATKNRKRLFLILAPLMVLAAVQATVIVRGRPAKPVPALDPVEWAKFEASMRANVGVPILEVRYCHSGYSPICASRSYGTNGIGYEHDSCYGAGCAQKVVTKGVTLSPVHPLDGRSLAAVKEWLKDAKLAAISCDVKLATGEGGCEGVSPEKSAPVLSSVLDIDHECSSPRQLAVKASIDATMTKNAGSDILRVLHPPVSGTLTFEGGYDGLLAELSHLPSPDACASFEAHRADYQALSDATSTRLQGMVVKERGRVVAIRESRDRELAERYDVARYLALPEMAKIQASFAAAGASDEYERIVADLRTALEARKRAGTENDDAEDVIVDGLNEKKMSEALERFTVFFRNWKYILKRLDAFCVGGASRETLGSLPLEISSLPSITQNLSFRSARPESVRAAKTAADAENTSYSATLFKLDIEVRDAITRALEPAERFDDQPSCRFMEKPLKILPIDFATPL